MQPLAPVYTLGAHVVRDGDIVSDARGSNVEPLVPGKQVKHALEVAEVHAPQPPCTELHDGDAKLQIAHEAAVVMLSV